MYLLESDIVHGDGKVLFIDVTLNSSHSDIIRQFFFRIYSGFWNKTHL